MFTVRREQIECLERAAFSRKLQKWLGEFRVELPAQTRHYSDRELQELLVSGVKAAEYYDLTDHALIREYLRVILRTGAGKDGRPALASVRSIMANPSLAPLEKMDRLAVLVPDPDAAAQTRLALARISNDPSRPPARPPAASTEREPAIDPQFLLVDGKRAFPDPDHAEW